MIKIVCDICLKELKTISQQPQGWCLCDAHLEFGERYYMELIQAQQKAAEAFRSRFIQTVIQPKQRQQLQVVK